LAAAKVFSHTEFCGGLGFWGARRSADFVKKQAIKVWRVVLLSDRDGWWPSTKGPDS